MTADLFSRALAAASLAIPISLAAVTAGAVTMDGDDTRVSKVDAQAGWSAPRQARDPTVPFVATDDADTLVHMTRSPDTTGSIRAAYRPAGRLEGNFVAADDESSRIESTVR